ncbi:MAG: alpha/beta fold hydrolase [Actinobacteria bacterium]|nr:alpha/beta fold hydrolase [Actinomycetota bacterium]
MTIAHDVAGEGPVVVLVHAGIADRRMWDPQWMTWSNRFRLVRYDLRGFGESPVPDGPYSHASDLVSLLDSVGPAAVVGVSLGGRVALETAVERPDLVEALVLVGPPFPGHAWSAEMNRFDEEEEAAVDRGDADGYVEANVRFWLDAGRPQGAVDPDVRALVRAMVLQGFDLQVRRRPEGATEELLVPDLAARASEVRAPVLVVVGADDVADMHTIAERLERELPNAERALVQGAAHLPSLERPADFDAVVLPFLERYGSRSYG